MGDRWFGLLLRLYPPSFRDEFKREMIVVFEALRAEARPTVIGRWSFRLRMARDTATTAARAWWNALRPLRGGPSPGGGHGERFAQDIRYAVRTLFKRPAFSVVVVGTLAVGIGANTAIFTLVNEILLRPLPIGNPERVVDIFADEPGTNSFSGFSYLDYVEYRGRNRTLDGLAAFRGSVLRLGPDGRGAQVVGQLSSANYFDVVDVIPLVGRGFLREEGIPGSGTTPLVIGYDFWQRHRGGDPSTLGSTIHLNGVAFTVVGILPRGFTGTFIGFPVDLWLPFPAGERLLPTFDLADRSGDDFEFLGRLARGSSIEQVRREFSSIAARLDDEFPRPNRTRGVGAAPTTGVDRSMRGGVVGFLGVLVGVTGIVLLIACLNVGGLLLARATSRQREMAVRLALGASRARLARQLLTETVLLFLVGGALAVFVATRITASLANFVSSLPVRLGFDLAVDWRVLTFNAGIAFVAAAIAGLFPIREAYRHEPIVALRTSEPDDAQRVGWLRNAFVVSQIAAVVVILTGAGLFVRSLREGVVLDPGFDADRVMAATISLPQERYAPPQSQAFFMSLAVRLQAVPDVEAVAWADRRPIGVTRTPMEIAVPGVQPPPGQTSLRVDANVVHPAYFETLNIPLMAGRFFTDGDGRDGPSVVIINRTMAERWWADQSAVGRSFTLNGEPATVVGVVQDSRYLVQDDAPVPYLYVPVPNPFPTTLNLLVRVPPERSETKSLIQSVIAEGDPELPPADVVSLRETIDASLLPQRLAAAVTSALGVFGVLLAALGIYGLLAHNVGRRTREIGIRMALGSSAGDVTRLVLTGGLRLALVGMGAGTGLALVLAPLLRRFLVNVHPADPITLVLVFAGLLTVVTVACFLPARRATTIDPVTTLRGQ